MQKRFLALDSLRGISAIAVALGHFSAKSHLTELPFVKNSHLFVDFFFVLSGFVIASSYGNKLQEGFSIGRFMFLRLGRLYPLHLFVILLYLPIAALGNYSWHGFWITTALLQCFSDGQLDNWNRPSWSISAEVWTYLIFALACRAPGRWFYVLLALPIVIAPPVLLVSTDQYLDVCYQGALLRCLYGFSMGALAFRFMQRAKWQPLSLGASTAIEAAVILTCLGLISVAGVGPLSFLCPPAFVVAVLVFAHEGGLCSVALKRPAMVLIGSLSYSIYMTHMFVQARFLNVIGVVANHVWLPFSKQATGAQTISSNIPFVADAVTVAMVLTVVGVAYLTFRFIEEPGRQWSRSTLSPRAPGAATFYDAADGSVAAVRRQRLEQ